MVEIQNLGAPAIAAGGTSHQLGDAVGRRVAPPLGAPPGAGRIRTVTSAPQVACDRDDAEAGRRGVLEAIALGITAWSQRWFPDTFIFALLALASVVFGALLIGARPSAIAMAFGDGFWNLIPFTMQMVMVVITGHVVASARATEIRPRGSGLRRDREHDGVATELGDERHRRRIAGARIGTAA